MPTKSKVNLGEVSKRASKILARQKSEFAAAFKAAHGNPKKIKSAAAEYRKKYGATPRTRRKNALKLAVKHTTGKQGTLRLR